MKPSKLFNILMAVLLALLVSWNKAAANEDYGNRLGVKRGGQVSFAPQGPGVIFDALDPALRKWHIPQELYKEYKWRQWEYSNYARHKYQRYVNTNLEGDYYYDLFGNFISRGWLIYNNSQTQPLQFGNSLLKSDRFGSWFTGLVVASDSKGQYHYAMTVSNQIRTTLTPMTFSKPNWDGVQFDVATDKYQGTLIYSRISNPGGLSTDNNESLLTNLTTMTGGRVTAQIGDFSTVGAHFVNSHQSNTLIKGFRGNPLAGTLTVDQNQAISFIELVLRDDSPEDGTGGAAYFPVGSDIIITYRNETCAPDNSAPLVDKGKEIRFEPAIQGGFQQQGFISADGTEEIRLLYDFDTPDFVTRAKCSKEDIEKVEFVLTLGNDYQVWATSNNQLTGSEPVLLLIAQAEGNVQDNTNLQVIEFEYGLPTATQILGTSVEFNDLLGFDFYGEYDVSLNYRQYPNVTQKTHSISAGISSQRAKSAWMMNLSKIAFPWFFFGEAYSMDPLYNTQTFVTGANGKINYGDERRHVVELVEDNDDQDRIPDLVRADSQVGDRRVFPGWDENYDFISDYNQNDNLTISNSLPDYDEAFLRHNVERPDFLFGVDMNNNIWVDRFENDERPDYPYPKDHRGFNVYTGYHFSPEARLTIGHMRESLISSKQRNHTYYTLFTLDKDTPTWGRFRFMEMVKSAKDNIPNDLLQWSPENTTRDGELKKLVDPLLAQDTWINTTWIGHDFNYKMLRLSNYLNWEYFNQRDKDALRDSDYFFGIVNKASYRQPLGNMWLEPRWKSEFRHQTIGLFTQGKDRVLSEIFGLLLGSHVLPKTSLETGVEYSVVNDMLNDSKDSTGWAIALQVTNVSAYLGYSITAQVGMKLDTRDFKGQDRETLSQGFVTIYAGLGE